MTLPTLNDKQKKVVKRQFKRLEAAQSILTEAQDRYANASRELEGYLHQEFPEFKGGRVQISSDGELREA